MDVNTVIAVATVAYSVISLFTLMAINNQYKEMKIARLYNIQPFVIIRSLGIKVSGPMARRLYYDQAPFSLATSFTFSISLENLGNSPATLLHVIGKLRLKDKNGKKYQVYTKCEALDCLAQGEKKTIELSFLVADNDLIRHLLELSKLHRKKTYINQLFTLKSVITCYQL
jgi:hypothetical protein